MATYTEDQTLTAMCIWEAMIERRDHNPQMDKRWNEDGSAVMRQHVLTLVPIADRVWSALGDDAPEPFDWEFCPGFVDMVYWDKPVPYVKDDDGQFHLRLLNYISDQ